LHTTVAIGEYQLAQAYALQGKYAEAKLLLEHALSIQERTYPLGHPVIADYLFALADLATLRQRYTEAEWYCQRAIAVYETSVGASYPGLANVLRHYAKLLRMNRSAEARALENRAKELQRAARSSK
jgi:tetratricopeptide (TPR) repeat protein